MIWQDLNCILRGISHRFKIYLRLLIKDLNSNPLASHRLIYYIKFSMFLESPSLSWMIMFLYLFINDRVNKQKTKTKEQSAPHIKDSAICNLQRKGAP